MLNHFLSCDWGSTAFRLRLVSMQDDAILAQVLSGKGATVLAAELPPGANVSAREAAFALHIEENIDLLQAQAGIDLAGAPVVISGLATSAHGWVELPYAGVPFSVDGAGLVWRQLQLHAGVGATRDVFLLSGVRTHRDVMRGEEAQIVGLFHTPQYAIHESDCLLVLPGTHCKHVLVRDGQITDFTTYMTGELYGVLAAHSVLGRSVASPADGCDSSINSSEARLAAFREGVQAALEEGLAASLFQVRVNGLFESYAPQDNAAFLSGLLVGSELLGLARDHSGRPILLCAGEQLLSPYREAFAQLARETRLIAVPADMAGNLSSTGHGAFLKGRLPL